MSRAAGSFLLALYRTGLVAALAWLGGPPATPREPARPGTLRTAPDCDHIIGYSGANDCEIELLPDGRIAAVRLLHSGDTPEHAAAVAASGEFFAQFVDLQPSAEGFGSLDGVSRATLTSLAILEAIALRTVGARTSLRFPAPIRLDEAQKLAPVTTQVKILGNSADLFAADGRPVGKLLRTGPGFEKLTGYQGPTDTLVYVDIENRVRGLSIRRSYDNPRYVRYVREDRDFAGQFVGQTLSELARLAVAFAAAANDLEGPPQQLLDGVSGATMTSNAVGEGILRAAVRALQTPPAPPPGTAPRVTAMDLAILLLVALAAALTFSRLRPNRTAQIVQSLSVIAVLGVLGGSMLSLDLLHGWATHTAPWARAPGLAVLVAAALLIPLTTGRQTYCHQLCPHGAVQRWTRRTRWQRPVPRRAFRVLRHLPMATLAALGLLLALGTPLPDLGNVEAFGAWAWPMAGWAALTLAAIGLLASCFYGMAYCRMGCPTGALLDLLRRRPKGDRFRTRDKVATLLVVTMAVRLWLWG